MLIHFAYYLLTYVSHTFIYPSKWHISPSNTSVHFIHMHIHLIIINLSKINSYIYLSKAPNLSNLNLSNYGWYVLSLSFKKHALKQSQPVLYLEVCEVKWANSVVCMLLHWCCSNLEASISGHTSLLCLPILATFSSTSFHYSCCHYNNQNLLFPHHAPKITGGLGQWTYKYILTTNYFHYRILQTNTNCHFTDHLGWQQGMQQLMLLQYVMSCDHTSYYSST